MSLVLDSSVALAFVYAEETSLDIRDVFQTVSRDGAWAPSLWRLEVANVLEMGVRRGRHGSEFRDQTLMDLSALPVRVDPETDEHAWTATARLAARYALTVYDAAYLELAERRRLPLATLDEALRRAASAHGIPLLGKSQFD